MRDGEAALKALAKAKPSQLPALVLLDLGLPGLGGLEVLRRIRADVRCKYMAVIAFTSDTSERDRGFALEVGANLFVVKPTDGEAFVKFVRWVDGLLEFLD